MEGKMIKMIKVLNILMAGGLIIFLPWGQRTIQPVRRLARSSAYVM
jgi:hypothetical protein